MAKRAIVRHPELYKAIPALSTSNAVVLTPSSYVDWTTAFNANTTKSQFLLTPGDYRGMGDLERVNKLGGSSGNPKVIRFYNPSDTADNTKAPWERSAQARVKRLYFETANTKFWAVQGLTVDAEDDVTDTSNGGQQPEDITFDQVLIQNCHVYSVRLQNSVRFTFQRCMIRNTQVQLDTDSLGIQCKPVSSSGVEEFLFVDSQIYNCGDCIQLTDGGADGTAANRWPVTGTIIGCDLYNDRYDPITNTSNDENGIDIKAGCDVTYGIVITGNRLWGFRRNSGTLSSEGEAIVIQRYARGIDIYDNDISDCPRAFKDENWKASGVGAGGGAQDMDESRNIRIRNNRISDIRDRATGDAGAVFKPICNGVDYTDNVISRCDYVFDVNPSVYRGSGPGITGNLLTQIEDVQRPGSNPSFPTLPYDPDENSTTQGTPRRYDSYERKIWLGTEFASTAPPAGGSGHMFSNTQPPVVHPHMFSNTTPGDGSGHTY